MTAATTKSTCWAWVPHPWRAFVATRNEIQRVWPSLNEVERKSPFVRTVVWIVMTLECLGAVAWCGPRILHQEDEADIVQRARRVETFVLWCCVLNAALIVGCAFGESARSIVRIPAAAFAAYTALNVVVTGMAIHVVHPIVVPHKKNKLRVSSVHRLTVLAFVNYFQLIAAFIPLYWTNPGGFEVSGSPNVSPSRWTDFLYVSIASQCGLGFGQLYPLESMRWVTALQCMTGVILALAILGRIVSILPTPDDKPSE